MRAVMSFESENFRLDVVDAESDMDPALVSTESSSNEGRGLRRSKNCAGESDR